MQKLFESFRKYLILTEDQLLIEGRKDDAKKKYPNLVKAGLLDKLIDADPSGNQKYLMWAAKIINDEIKDAEEIVSPDPPESLDPTQFEFATEDLATALQKYHKLQPYIRDEDKKFKDINNIKSLNSLIQLVDRLRRIKDEIERVKELKRHQKQQAMQDSTILINDDDFMLVRPTSAEASCYWGMGTRWCISAEESENYFNRYTNEGKSFYFLLSKHKDNFGPGTWETYKKLALVFLNDGAFEEAYDASDLAMDAAAVQEIIAVNLLGSQVSDAYQEYTRYYNMEKLKAEAPAAYTILVDRMLADGLTPEDDVDDWWGNTVVSVWDDIWEAASADTQENPPGPSEADFHEIIENANLQHIDVSVDEYDVGAWGWSAYMAFDFEDLEWGDKALAEHELEDEINEVLDSNYIYANEVEGYQNQVHVNFSTEDSGYGESDIDRFSSFVGGLEEADAKYDETYQDLIDMFIEKEALDISTSPYGQLRSKAKTQEYEHFEADTSEGTVSYYINMDLKIPEIGEIVQSLTRDLKAVGDELGLGDFDHSKVLGYLNDEFERVFRRVQADFSFGTNFLLDALSKHFLEAQNQAMRQLNLPGVPAAEIRQLITPSKFKIKWATLNIAEKKVALLLGMALGRKDDEDQMKALGEFIDYFDKNYDEFESIVRSVVVKALHSAAGEVKEYAESTFYAPHGSLPPSYEPTAVDYTSTTAHQAGLRPFVENRKRKRIRITIQR